MSACAVATVLLVPNRPSFSADRNPGGIGTSGGYDVPLASIKAWSPDLPLTNATEETRSSVPIITANLPSAVISQA